MHPVIRIDLDPNLYSLEGIDQHLIGLAINRPEFLVEAIPKLKITKNQKIALLAESLKKNNNAPKIILQSITELGFDRKKGNRVSLIAKMILINIESFQVVFVEKEMADLITCIKKNDMEEILPNLSKNRFLQVGGIISKHCLTANSLTWADQLNNSTLFTPKEKAKYSKKFSNIIIKNGLDKHGL